MPIAKEIAGIPVQIATQAEEEEYTRQFALRRKQIVEQARKTLIEPGVSLADFIGQKMGFGVGLRTIDTWSLFKYLEYINENGEAVARGFGGDRVSHDLQTIAADFMDQALAQGITYRGILNGSLSEDDKRSVEDEIVKGLDIVDSLYEAAGKKIRRRPGMSPLYWDIETTTNEAQRLAVQSGAHGLLSNRILSDRGPFDLDRVCRQASASKDRYDAAKRHFDRATAEGIFLTEEKLAQAVHDYLRIRIPTADQADIANDQDRELAKFYASFI